MEYPMVIQRKKTKSVEITVKLNGEVIVSVPADMNDDAIKRVLEKKESWITEQLKEMEARRKYIPQFVDGGNIWFFGKPYTLRVIDAEKDEVSLNDKEMVVKVTSRETERIKHTVVEWLKKQAREVIKEKTEKFAEILGVKPESIELKQSKRYWGRCKFDKESKTGTIDFNWILIHLPEELIDYIVVHELAHLVYQHHKRSFWLFVAKAIPDCEQREKETAKWSGLIMGL